MPALEKTMRCGKFDDEKSARCEAQGALASLGRKEKTTVKTGQEQRIKAGERVY